MQLSFRLFWILIIIGIQTFAQKAVELEGGKRLYSDIYQVAYKHIDDLQKINENGVLLIKIDLLDRKIKDVTFSSEHPAQLISILQSTIKRSAVELNSPLLTSVIIPVFYNYKTSLTRSASDLLNQAPSIDVNKSPMPTFQLDYDKFLGIKSTDNKVLGIYCIFLPWIKLSGKTE